MLNHSLGECKGDPNDESKLLNEMQNISDLLHMVKVDT